jgi:cell division protease FtsH
MKLKKQNWWVWVGLGLILVAVFGVAVSITNRPQVARTDVVPLSRAADALRQGDVTRLEVGSGRLVLTLQDGSQIQAIKEPNASLEETLAVVNVPPNALKNVEVEVVGANSASFGTILIYLLPTVLLIGVLIFFMQRTQGPNNAASSFGQSGARLRAPHASNVTFRDVAGAEEAKQELREIVEFLSEPAKFIALGARIPKGILLVGSPGTGKTLLAKAVAGEAGVPFFSISGSQFVEMFVGVGASRVRDLFRMARRHSPCIVFVDEIDAVGRQRGTGLGGGHDEREQTLNQILVEMDGFDTDTNVIVMAATNRPDILDPALLRPGRFDRRITVDRPDLAGRKAILEVHTRGKPLASDVDLGKVAKTIAGFVGADIENLVNEAAILAARRSRKSIGASEFQEAIERLIAGPERKSRLISAEERRVIAYHEAGHAVVMRFMEGCDPVEKVSIIGRGMMGGFTLAVPEYERILHPTRKFQADLAGLLGGRAAEELVFGEVTTGAANDLERATQTARAMVTRYGMSEKLGPLVYGHKDEMQFLGKSLGEQRNYSDAVAEQIDGEVRRTVAEAYEQAAHILAEQRQALDRVAQTLLDKETIDGDELIRLCGSVRKRRQPAKAKTRPQPVRRPAAALRQPGRLLTAVLTFASGVRFLFSPRRIAKVRVARSSPKPSSS